MTKLSGTLHLSLLRIRWMRIFVNWLTNLVHHIFHLTWRQSESVIIPKIKNGFWWFSAIFLTRSPGRQLGNHQLLRVVGCGFGNSLSSQNYWWHIYLSPATVWTEINQLAFLQWQNRLQTLSKCLFLAHWPQIQIPEKEYDVKVSSHALIWPQGDQKQLSKVYWLRVCGWMGGAKGKVSFGFLYDLVNWNTNICQNPFR